MNSSQPTRFEAVRLTALCVALFAAYPLLAHAGVAGRVQFVAGDVRVVDAQGKDQPMRKGQEVNEGDTVLSAAGASAQLKMIDGAVIAVRPGTQLKLVGYQFNGKEDGTEKASFSLAKGGMRAITGLIGRTNKDRYRIETPTATIGIRGTDHEPVVVLPTPNGAIGGAAPGTYDKVNVGATAMTTQAGTTLIAPNQVGFAGSPTQVPVILPTVPEFYRSSTAAAPATQAPKQEKKESRQAAAASESGQAESGEAAPDDGKATASAASAATETAPAADAGAPKSTATVGATRTAEPALALATAAPAPLAPTATFTAVDDSGNRLDLANQTVKTASGVSVPLTDPLPAPVEPPVTPPVEPPVEPVPVDPTQMPKSGVIMSASFPVPYTSPETISSGFHFPEKYFYWGPIEGLTRDAVGNVVRAEQRPVLFDIWRDYPSLSQSGSTITDFGKHDATGLSWGRWQGGTVTITQQEYGYDASGNFGLGAYDNVTGNFVIGGNYAYDTALGKASLHWIAGPTTGPDFLPQVLTGTANYTSVGGTRPTDTNGNIGSFTKATLGVNFTMHTADASIDFAIAGDAWNMRSDGMRLWDTHFSSYDRCASSTCTNDVVLTKNGTLIPQTGEGGYGAYGAIEGFLTGPGLNGAALQYSVETHAPKITTDPYTGFPIYNGTEHNLIQGAAALAGPTQDVNTPFRVVALGGAGMDFDYFYGETGDDGKPLYRGTIEGSAAPATRVVDDAGGLREFLGSAFDFTPLSGGIAYSSYDDPIRSTIKIGTAVNRDVGSASIGGATISWGRWEGGTVDIYSGDGATKLGTVDNSNRSLHWLSSSILNSKYFAMPMTGTATYALVGNTNPTDLKGNVGTLGSATLKADFANAKVDAGVNVSFNSASNTSNWSMTAKNVPLSGSGEFQSSTMINGINGITHSASCSGPSCGGYASGYIDGHMIGGAQGAVMMYNMKTSDAVTGATVNGVTGLVVMKR